MKLHEGITQFEVQLRAEGRSCHTISSYLRDLRYLTNHVGEDCDVATISIEILNQVLISEPVTTQANGQPKAPISINKTKTTFKSFFRFLYVINAISFNPADTIRIKYYERKFPEISTDQERKVLFKRLHDSKGQRAFRDRIIYSLFLNTGIRLMELVKFLLGQDQLFKLPQDKPSKGTNQLLP